MQSYLALSLFLFRGGKSLSTVSFHRGSGQQRQRSACSLGEWQSSGSWRTHHDWEQNQTPACWMCQVSQLCLMLSAIPGCKADTNLFGWRWRSFGPFCLPRLCSDGEDVHLYHTTDNSRVYHKEELKSLEIPAQVNEESRNCCVRRCKWCCSIWRNCFPFRTWMLLSSWSTPTPNLCLWEVYHAILLMTRSDTLMF